MDKAEKLKRDIDDLICLKWISDTMRKHVWWKIDEYAQQVSREMAEKAFNSGRRRIIKKFDNWWQSNQEESNGN